MENKKEIEKILDKAALKALNDASFKKRLLIDANSEIKKEFSVDLPFKVTFHESSPEHLIFVLPDLIAPNSELSDDNLENVSGGQGEAISSSIVKPVTAYAALPDFKI